MRRNLKRVLAIVTVVSVLWGSGVVRPAPTLAVDTEEGVIYATAAAAGWVAFVVVGTLIVYPHLSVPTATLPVDWKGRAAQSQSSFRFASHCPQASTGVTFACW